MTAWGREAGSGAPCAALVLFALVARGRAQEPELPAAEALLEEFQRAVGEAGAKPLRLTGTVSWDMEGTSPGSFTEIHRGLREVRVTMEFPTFGQFEYGCDGETVWETNPLEAREQTGWDAAEFLRRLGIAGHVDWKEMYASARCVGEESVDGVRCYQLEMTPKALFPVAEEGAVPLPDLWYLEAESKLLRRASLHSVGADGSPIARRMDLGGWREAGGKLHAFRQDVLVSGYTMHLRYEKVERGAQLAADAFAMDPRSREQLAQRRESGDGPVLETLEPRPIASIRVTCKHAELQKTLAVLLPEVGQHVVSSGARMAGPPLVRYHSFGDTVDLEAGMPLMEPTTPRGRVQAETLPGGPAVLAWHVGPYEKLGDTHAKMMAYMQEHGLVARGSPWEEYWTDPGMEPDPGKWRTRVVYPVAEAKGE